MSFKLMILGSMYKRYFNNFYSNFPEARHLDYNAHNELLIQESTEFCASYTRNFRKLGVETQCIIDNDIYLQKKWKKENKCSNVLLRDVVKAQIIKYKPDVLFVEDLSFINKSYLKEVLNDVKSIRLIFAFYCSTINDRIITKLKCFDFVIAGCPGTRDCLLKNGIKSYLVYHGFDEEISKKLSNEPKVKDKYKISFSGSLFQGTGAHKERLDLINYLFKSDIDISLFLNLESCGKITAKKIIYLINKVLKGLKLNAVIKYVTLLNYVNEPVYFYSSKLLKYNKGPLFGKEMYKLLGSSSIVLNIHGSATGDYACNMRIFEATGMGACLLTDKKINTNDLFEPGKEIVVYNDHYDCLNKIKWLLQNDEVRRKIAHNGQTRTKKYHTIENRCSQIIDIINTELNRKAIEI